MPRSRYKSLPNDTTPYFITTSVVNWLPAFSSPQIANIILDSLNFLQNANRLTLHGYVLMENHLHLVASSADLSAEMRKFKSYTARQCIDYYQQQNNQWMLQQLHNHKPAHKQDQAYQFWQEGFHPKQIQTEEILRDKLEYIHNNPVARGYVDDPVHWRYSSYRCFMGRDDVVLPVTKLV